MVLFIYAVIAFFYTSLQSRYIFGGDSAEYSTVAKIWGISHPPGYPLYSFLINVINRVVPFSSTPWKIALLSSIPTVITAYCIYKILCTLKIEKYIAFLISILYLFLFPVWQYALIPEVFALHTMLVSLITYFILKYSHNNKQSVLLFASFLCGLCISNHHIFVLFIPGWIYLLKDKLKTIYQNKNLLTWMLISVFLGASFYLYVIIISSNKSILDWENAKTIQGFFNLITRSSYGSFKAYSSSGANFVNQLSDMISSLVFILLDFKPLGIVFICSGLFASRKYGKQLSMFLSITLSLHFAFLFYTNFVLTNSFSEGMFERFLIPLYLVLILLLGIGVDFIYKNVFLQLLKKIHNLSLINASKVGYFVFLALFITIVAIKNYRTIKYIPLEKTFEQFGIDIVETVPQGGILITKGDTSTFTTYYQLYGLQKRRDLIFFQLGLMNKDHYVEMIKEKAPQLMLSNPIKGTEDFKIFLKQNSKYEYFADSEMTVGTWRPYGVLWKYYPDNLSAASDSALLHAINKTLWEKKYTFPTLSSDERNIFHLKSVEEYYLDAYQNYAKMLILMNKYEEAEEVLKKIAFEYKKDDPQSQIVVLNFLVYQKKCQEAAKLAKKIGIADTIIRYPGFVKPALTYLEACDPYNKMIPVYQKNLLKYQDESKTGLSSF